jgi:hypothetical protein
MLMALETPALVATILAHPLDPTPWQIFAAVEQAGLRCSMMRDMACADWERFPAWYWRLQHHLLLELKLCCAMATAGEPC